jgi:hypothetical protein
MAQAILASLLASAMAGQNLSSLTEIDAAN